MAITVLALDLEGTLISNAMSQVPRPGLFAFLESCRELFPRVVMFTTVEEAKFRSIANLLVKEGVAPDWFSHIEYIKWTGNKKDLSFISGTEVKNVLLVDDFEGYIHPDQTAQWIKIELFDYPYSDSDMGLASVMHALRDRLDRDL